MERTLRQVFGNIGSKHVSFAEDAAGTPPMLQEDDLGPVQQLVARSIACLDSGTPDTLQVLRGDIVNFGVTQPGSLDACKQLIAALRTREETGHR